MWCGDNWMVSLVLRNATTKKMSGNLMVAGQTALGGEIAKDCSSTICY
jgi:hypothetical protein